MYRIVSPPIAAAMHHTFGRRAACARLAGALDGAPAANGAWAASNRMKMPIQAADTSDQKSSVPRQEWKKR